MIYVHVPFCKSFCTYCDFFSETACVKDYYERYLEDLEREASLRREEIESSRTHDTLYIGGGTPSVLPLWCLERMVRCIGGPPAGEFTIEVNPEDIVGGGLDYAKGLKALGANRISMGVQTLDDTLLIWMNRRHDSARAKLAFSLLREAGFDNISVDIIFGVSNQGYKALLGTLEGILSWGPDHISAYQLSIEDGSALARMILRGDYVEAEDEECSRQYGIICQALRGWNHYEISNWARPGFEASHNSAYWTRKSYVGLGPGAHSFNREAETRCWNSEQLRGWTSFCEALGQKEIREEEIMLGLRTAAGIPAGLCDNATLKRMMDEGSLVQLDNGNVRIPESHFFISDSIIADLV